MAAQYPIESAEPQPYLGNILPISNPKLKPGFSSSSVISSRKRPRFNKNSSKRHGGVAYVKESPATSLCNTAKLPCFPVYTSNLGVSRLALISFDIIRCKDYRLSMNITVLQLEYALTIAYMYRVVMCSCEYAYSYPQNISLLRQVGKGIILPDVLAKYIESIGIVKLASGVSITPFSGNYRDLFPSKTTMMRDPAAILADAERPPIAEDWSIDRDYLLSYNAATTRASRSGMQFRTVNHDKFEGRIEMAVSYLREGGDYVSPRSPEKMIESECQLGACYQFRDICTTADWLGGHKQLLYDAMVARSIDVRVHFHAIVTRSFLGNSD